MSQANGRRVTPPPAKVKGGAGERLTRRYPTMGDVAAATGVHATTVSLALRSHPSIPATTRQRIVSAAAALGYERDPLLDAFNFHRLHKRATHDGATIAFVVDSATCSYFFGQAFHPLVYQGAKAAALAHHHALEVFKIGPNDLSPKRLNTIIASRGISGVLLSTFTLRTTELELDWQNLSVVKIESHHLLPQMDVVTNDQCQAARLCMRRLRALGYRRIGLATARDDESRLQDNFSTGVLVEQAELPEGECVPPLLFERSSVATITAQVADWIRRHDVDVVMSNWPELLGPGAPAAGLTLANTRLRIPEDIAFASLDVPHHRADIGGIVQNHRLVGMRAMEQLSVLVRTFHRGAPDAPSVTYLPGYWRDGATVPLRATAARAPVATA